VCKTGVGDVLIGTAATVADYDGVERASHVRDKLVEMTTSTKQSAGQALPRATKAWR
jgi:aromatic ring hydroxylase